MNKKYSYLRQQKRAAMKKHKTTWTDRLREAIRLQAPVKDISFRLEKPKVEI